MQQYTCPKCLRGYTDETSYQHIPCGTVEAPKEQTITLPEPIDSKPIEFVEPVLENADTVNANIDSDQTIVKPEQKKRGRPAMNKGKS